MIKISIKVEDFNKINKFGKKYTGTDSRINNRNLQHIRFTILDDTLIAEGLDGYKLFKITIKIDNLNNENGVFYLTTMKNFKKSDKYIIIEESEKFINLKTKSDNRYIEKKNVKFFDTANIINTDNSNFNIQFNAKKLSDALAAYGNENIELSFTQQNEMVIIKNNKDIISMLLPLRYV